MATYLLRFGDDKAGLLATVGWRLRTGATYVTARSQAGLSELGQGDYQIDAALPATFAGVLEADTGEATPTYARQVIAATQGASAPAAPGATTGGGGGGMTRAKLRERIQNTLGEVQGTAGGDNPFALDDLLSEECDELARMSYCWHTFYTDDVSPGLADFCAPPIFRITAVTILDASGTPCPLQEARPQSLDAVCGSRWRDPARRDVGTPRYYLPSGLNEVQLYPVPDYAQTAGLTVYGFGCPGETWPGDADACPLPERVHNTVWQGAALRRIVQTPTPENMARAPMLRAMYDAGRGKLEREAATLSRAQRHRQGGF